MKKIQPQDLTLMNATHYRVDLAYARADNLLFGQRIYHQDAKLWLHRDLAAIVDSAARLCLQNYNLRFILYDGLRTSDAQSAMMETKRVKQNPHWLEEPRLLSPAGAGGHPRAMAVDIGLETCDGALLDMGCAFDFLAKNADEAHNPAHRKYNHPQKIKDHRDILDHSMSEAAKTHNHPLLPLPEEWWDFRFPRNIYEQYTPLSEDDLPTHMRLL